jgi:hypothetical protein
MTIALFQGRAYSWVSIISAFQGAYESSLSRRTFFTFLERVTPRKPSGSFGLLAMKGHKGLFMYQSAAGKLVSVGSIISFLSSVLGIISFFLDHLFHKR